MNLERHDISIKTSEEEGFDIYILYHPSACTRSATHDQPEEWSEVDIEGVYYDKNDHKLSAEHMARLPFDKADLLDVKEIDWSDPLSEIKERMLNFKDFYGQDLLGVDEVNNCNSKAELARILDEHEGHLEDMLSDARSNLSNFRESLGGLRD